jgi:hypothetical protein
VSVVINFCVVVLTFLALFGSVQVNKVFIGAYALLSNGTVVSRVGKDAHTDGVGCDLASSKFGHQFETHSICLLFARFCCDRHDGAVVQRANDRVLRGQVFAASLLLVPVLDHVLSAVSLVFLSESGLRAHAKRLRVALQTYKFHERVQVDSLTSNELGDPDDLVSIDRDDECVPAAKLFPAGVGCLMNVLSSFQIWRSAGRLARSEQAQAAQLGSDKPRCLLFADKCCCACLRCRCMTSLPPSL